MNRRLRCLCRSGKRDEHGLFLRYLRPGALALLRDSKISARSHSRRPKILLYRPPSTPSSPSNNGSNGGVRQISVVEGFPCFASRSFGPRCPQRKKLVAAKSFLFINSNPSSPGSDSASPDSVVDVFAAADVIVSH